MPLSCHDFPPGLVRNMGGESNAADAPLWAVTKVLTGVSSAGAAPAASGASANGLVAEAPPCRSSECQR